MFNRSASAKSTLSDFQKINLYFFSKFAKNSFNPIIPYKDQSYDLHWVKLDPVYFE